MLICFGKIAWNNILFEDKIKIHQNAPNDVYLYKIYMIYCGTHYVRCNFQHTLYVPQYVMIFSQFCASFRQIISEQKLY